MVGWVKIFFVKFLFVINIYFFSNIIQMSVIKFRIEINIKINIFMHGF
jgi:hypothetical protein